VYEIDYSLKLGNHLARRFRKVRPLPISDYEPFYKAWKGGVISETEWEDAARLDVIALARDASLSDEPEVVIAMELSKVVDANDVERAHRRASILGKSGVPVLALVDGESIETSAKSLAAAQGVIALVQKEAQPA
ncbi:MAG: hypothetical protein ACRDHF_12780, partial [Tepidiformaceae bacterium]